MPSSPTPLRHAAGPRGAAVRSPGAACAALFAALVALGGPAAAQTDPASGVTIIVEELPENRYLDVVRSLGDDGYRILSISRTLLNRIRIQATNDAHLREIVFSQSSGEIMRDVILEQFRAGRASP
jgi:hypothetical protein